MTISFKKLALSVFALTLALGVQAQTLYVFENDTALKDAKGKVAKIFTGVPVSVIQKDKKAFKVSIEGFQEGLKMYSTPKKELLIATLGKGFSVKKKSGTKVILTGLIAKDALINDAAEVWMDHEEFFFEACTQCHAAPKVPHLTMIEWEAIFGTMKGFAQLDEEESAYLLRYLKSNASNGLIKAQH